jgi:hypothetical protein
MIVSILPSFSILKSAAAVPVQQQARAALCRGAHPQPCGHEPPHGGHQLQHRHGGPHRGQQPLHRHPRWVLGGGCFGACLPLPPAGGGAYRIQQPRHRDPGWVFEGARFAACLSLPPAGGAQRGQQPLQRHVGWVRGRGGLALVWGLPASASCKTGLLRNPLKRSLCSPLRSPVRRRLGRRGFCWLF